MAEKPVERVFWVAGCDRIDFGPTLAKVTCIEKGSYYDIVKAEWVMGEPLYTNKIPKRCTANPPSGPVRDGVYGMLSWHDTPQAAMQAIRDYVDGRQKWIVDQIGGLRKTSADLDAFDARLGSGFVAHAIDGDDALNDWLARSLAANHARIRADLMGEATDGK